MVSFPDLISTLTDMVKRSEDLLSLIYDDESRMDMWEEEVGALEQQANIARGMLLAAGHPVKD